MKKINILLLLLIFMFCINLNCYAASDEEVINKVQNEKIMEGTDNGFMPLKTLTRAEIITIVVRMKGMENEAITALDFSDVSSDNWAYKYICIATKAGITKGTGNGEFSPNREVTVGEAVTMIVRAVTNSEEIEVSGAWPDNYMAFAKKNNLLVDITKTKNDIISRIDTARIITNVLSSPNWSNKDENEIKDNSNEVLEEDEEGKIPVSRVGAGVIVSIATMADDYNAIELATPYGIVELTAHNSELTEGTVLPGTYVDFWLAGKRMWDIDAKPVTNIESIYHKAKIINFADGVVKLVFQTDKDGNDVINGPEFMAANNIIFLKCDKMNETKLDANDENSKILRTFDKLEFGNESDIELASDYNGISYKDIDATDVFYQSIEVDDEERIVAIIYEK